MRSRGGTQSLVPSVRDFPPPKGGFFWPEWLTCNSIKESRQSPQTVLNVTRFSTIGQIFLNRLNK